MTQQLSPNGKLL
jgi:hypothetical protein